MGAEGAVFADANGNSGFCPARRVNVKDTTGAGDAFCAGAAIGLTYGKTMAEACQIGSHLAASVIMTSENVCPRFMPGELGLDIPV
jgi:pseudouridine kinase